MSRFCSFVNLILSVALLRSARGFLRFVFVSM